MARRAISLAVALVATARPLAAQILPVPAPIDRLGGTDFTLTADDAKCGELVAAELERRLMRRVAKPASGDVAKGGTSALAVTVNCSTEAPRFRASVTIADASGEVLYKASGSTGAGFKGSQSNFIASVVENIFAP